MPSKKPESKKTKTTNPTPLMVSHPDYWRQEQSRAEVELKDAITAVLRSVVPILNELTREAAERREYEAKRRTGRQ